MPDAPTAAADLPAGTAPLPDCSQLQAVFTDVRAALARAEIPFGFSRLDRAEQLNRAKKDIEKQSDLLNAECARTRNPPSTHVPLSALKGEVMTSDPNSPVLGLIERMQQFDWLAMHLQRVYWRRLAQVCLSALAFLVCFELFAHMPYLRGHWLVLLTGVSCLVAGFGQLFYGESRRFQIAFHQARCTAEGLRVLVFWRLNGIGDRITGLVAPRHQARMGLVIGLLDAMAMPSEGPGVSLPPARGARGLTTKHWVRDQLEYLYGAYYRQHISEDVFRTLSTILFAWGVVAIVGLIALALHGGHMELGLEEYLLTLAPVLVVAAAVSEFHAERRGYDANAKRYEFAHHVYLGTHTANPASAPLDAAPSGSEQHRWPPEKRRSWIWAGVAAVCVLGLTAVATVGDVHGWVVLALAATAGFAGSASVRTNLSRLSAEVGRARADNQATLDNWCDLAEAWEREGDITERVKAAGKEAMHEVIDWYISNVDREIGLPKG